MNKYFFLIIILISSLCFAQLPKGNTFIYELSSDVEFKSSKSFDLIKSTSNPVEYIYTYNGEQALFVPIEKLNNSQTLEIDMVQIFVRANGMFYYDYKNQFISNKKNLMNKEYLVTSKFDDLYWIDLNETEEINGVLTKKYNTKRKDKGLKEDKIITTTIWVDETYSDNIAPFGLMGLKGIIVKANFNGGNNLILKRIETNPLKEIKPLNAKNEVTKEEFQEIIDQRMLEYRRKRAEKLEINN
ncbi:MULTISPECIES: hypothetical protein [Empedobacter]|uniref:GLPGLI family protein n=1 Tax=Empedobacter falsenii TaxID=343874 RepID=A0A3R8SKU0_9FLAO|nr:MULTISPECIES: hypothetical protein [Empedobacter]MDH0675162.1 hypothetical protein [Empedobacter sp. GD03861]MDH1603028.1 hypothetical protein [Empedobacter sp. GD03739]RRT89813.1 hypothetical protein EGI88_10750 [Empedobacter falsenii]RRT89866.1 hypothetical protein EGI89_10855 [Empedobacter falsenii]